MPKEYTLIGGNGTRVSPLEVTESGTYEAGDSRAFNPVKVNVPSGSSTLSGLTDVDISNPTDGQVLVYDAEMEKWVNGESAGRGGLLVIHEIITENDGTFTIVLDKTWQEIADSDGAVLILDADEEEPFVKSWSWLYQAYVGGDNDDEYFVAFFSPSFNQERFELVTDSPNGYPAYTETQG